MVLSNVCSTIRIFKKVKYLASIQLYMYMGSEWIHAGLAYESRVLKSK